MHIESRDNDEKHEEAQLIASEKQSVEEETKDRVLVESVLMDTHHIAELDKKLQEMKSKADSSGFIDIKEAVVETSSVQKAAHPESVVISSDSAPESPLSPTNGKPISSIDKINLGSKSPKEREEDVAIIVASVAEVLKSDAPLEEFEGKLPLKNLGSFTPYTTELRETHITAVESPTKDDHNITSVDEKGLVSSFLEEEKKLVLLMKISKLAPKAVIQMPQLKIQKAKYQNTVKNRILKRMI